MTYLPITVYCATRNRKREGASQSANKAGTEKTATAKALEHFRELKGLSRLKFAKQNNIPYTTYCRFEDGQSEPRTDDIKKLCKSFGITETEFFNWPDEETWELRLLLDKRGAIDLRRGAGSTATLQVSQTSMGITLSAGLDLWLDDDKFEGLVNQLREKRAIGIKTAKEWGK